MIEQKAICWDCVDTLVHFGAKQGVKPDIEIVLSDLSKFGFVHFVTSSGRQETAESDIKKAGIRHLFRDVLGREQIGEGGKKYLPIAQIMMWTKEEAEKRMIVVGDRTADTPIDLNPVFILFENGWKYSATVDCGIIARLEEAGHGDFIKGFDVIFERGTDSGLWQRKVDLGDGIVFDLRKGRETMGDETMFKRKILDIIAPSFRVHY